MKTDYTPSKDINSGSSEEDNRWSTAAPTAKSSAPDQPTTIKTASDNQVKEFLHGKLCLSGKLGWWTHEICFNKHVRQYHEVIQLVSIFVLLISWVLSLFKSAGIITLMMISLIWWVLYDIWISVIQKSLVGMESFCDLDSHLCTFIYYQWQVKLNLHRTTTDY
ncbi:unnamed protein product [Trichobilharzia regenti]|nr:unnamed protein product [Trichobilharzia regenti]